MERLDSFEVAERVERLACDSERSRYGSITRRAHLDDGDNWLVTDFDGVTHLDCGTDLARQE